MSVRAIHAAWLVLALGGAEVQSATSVTSATPGQLTLIPGAKALSATLGGAGFDEVKSARLVDARGGTVAEVSVELRPGRGGTTATVQLTAGSSAKAAKGLELQLLDARRRAVTVDAGILALAIGSNAASSKPLAFPTGRVRRADAESMRARGSSESIALAHEPKSVNASCASCHAPVLVPQDGWSSIGVSESRNLILRKPFSDHPFNQSEASVSFASSSPGVVFINGGTQSSGDYWVQSIRGQSAGSATVTATITLQGTIEQPKATHSVVVGASTPVTWTGTLDESQFSPTPSGFGYISGKSISAIVNSQVTGRADNLVCSQCHYSGSGRPYSPSIEQGATSTFLATTQVSGKIWRGGSGWAASFPASKPAHLKAMFAKWLEDGGN